MSVREDGWVLDLRRVLKAPRERIFRTLTEPAELAKWWGPRGFTAPEIDLDLRVGGRYRFAMQPPDGDLFYLAGEYLEIDSPRRLVYTFYWEEPDPDDRETVVSLSLHDRRDATELSLSQGEFATSTAGAHRVGWMDSRTAAELVGQAHSTSASPRPPPGHRWPGRSRPQHTRRLPPAAVLVSGERLVRQVRQLATCSTFDSLSCAEWGCP
jgi:uncharacterized protein YndB with AHSA1/START domain